MKMPPKLKTCFRRIRPQSLTMRVLFVSMLAVTMTTSGLYAPSLSIGEAASAQSERHRAAWHSSQTSGGSRHADIEDPRAMLRESARLTREDSQLANANDVPRKKKKKQSSIVPTALVTLVVTNTGDNGGINPPPGAGTGTLRQAIVDANTNGMPDEIVFNIPVGDPGFDALSGTFVIRPTTPWLILTGGDTEIDGTTQTAFTGDTNPLGPEVVINGSLAVFTPPPPNPPSSFTPIRLGSANNIVRALVINGFSLPGGGGIQIFGANAINNTVVGCYIGTDATGASIVANSGPGVNIFSGAHTTRVGGTAIEDRNVISGNGVGINNTSFFNFTTMVSITTGNNVIQGNYIGVDRTGAVDLGNLSNGISIVGTTDNVIGGTAAGAGNVASGNGQNGIRIAGRAIDTTPPMGPPEEPDTTGPYVVHISSGNIVQGNKFGTNATGTAAIPNDIDGVRLNYGAQQNIVGGTSPAARNICSGNGAHGIHFDGVRPIFFPAAPVAQNIAQGNYVGTDAAGAGDVGNELPGVIFFLGASENLLGGTSPGEGNVIAFNRGKLIDDGQGGFIPVPGAGVSISYDPAFVDPNFANDPTVRNRISGNSIHSNVRVFSTDGLGIDLNASGNETDATDGVTTNDAGDADDGGNRLQNYPVLTSVSSSGGTTTVQGTLNSTPATTFQVEFFANTACDPSGYGEGETFIGFTSVTTDAAGNASFTTMLSTNVGCRSVTATATDPLGNTSEFSTCLNQAPTVGCAVGTGSLWPSNHNLINVGLTATASDNCPGVTTSVQVFSDEDDEAPTGDGNHSPDAKDIATGTLRLRAERDGGADGRVYLIVVTATDSSGNTSRCCQTVTVPKSQSKADKQSVANQAAAAAAYCAANGVPPPGFVVVGDGPVVGPKQ